MTRSFQPSPSKSPSDVPGGSRNNRPTHKNPNVDDEAAHTNLQFGERNRLEVLLSVDNADGSSGLATSDLCVIGKAISVDIAKRQEKVAVGGIDDISAQACLNVGRGQVHRGGVSEDHCRPSGVDGRHRICEAISVGVPCAPDTPPDNLTQLRSGDPGAESVLEQLRNVHVLWLHRSPDKVAASLGGMLLFIAFNAEGRLSDDEIPDFVAIDVPEINVLHPEIQENR